MLEGLAMGILELLRIMTGICAGETDNESGARSLVLMLLGDIRQNKKALKPSCRVEISSKPWLKSRCRPSSVSYSLGPLPSQACWRGERVSVGKEFWACWRNHNFGWGATEQALSRQEASCSPYDGSSFIPGWFLKSLENALGEGSSSGKNVLDPQAASNLHQ